MFCTKKVFLYLLNKLMYNSTIHVILFTLNTCRKIAWICCNESIHSTSSFFDNELWNSNYELSTEQSSTPPPPPQFISLMDF